MEPSQYTSDAFAKACEKLKINQSMRRVGSAYDNAPAESFWARMQVELLNRKRWETRVEPANTIFEYLEILHNRHRRHSSLEMHTPIEYETIHRNQPDALPSQVS
jgi:putative transposase